MLRGGVRRRLGPAPPVAVALVAACLAAITFYAVAGVPQVATRVAPNDPDPARRTLPPAVAAQALAVALHPLNSPRWVWGLWQGAVLAPNPQDTTGFPDAPPAPIPDGWGLANPVGHVQGTDFLAYYTAGYQVAQGWTDHVYSTPHREALHGQIAGFDTRAFGFAYPPYLWPVLEPLGTLPYQWALWIWLGGMVAVIVLARQVIRPGWVSLLLVLSYPAVVQNLITGQNGALSAALLMGGLAALSRGRPLLGGALFAAMGFKPQLAILLPLFLLAGREFRAFVALGVAGVGWLAFTVVLYGVTPWLMWVDQVHESAGYLTADGNPFAKVPSVFVGIFRLTGSEQAAQGAQIVSGLAALSAGLWVWWRTRDTLARLLAVVATIGLSTPYLYDYDLVILLPVFLALWDRAQQRGVRWRDYGFLLALWAAPIGLWLMVDPLSRAVGLQAPRGLQAGALLFVVLGIAAVVRGAQTPQDRRSLSAV